MTVNEYKTLVRNMDKLKAQNKCLDVIRWSTLGCFIACSIVFIILSIYDIYDENAIRFGYDIMLIIATLITVICTGIGLYNSQTRLIKMLKKAGVDYKVVNGVVNISLTVEVDKYIDDFDISVELK